MSRRPIKDRFSLGEYYLEQTHRDRGGYWYACKFDKGTGQVRRRSLGEEDFEQAKIKLAALIATAPKDSASTPSSSEVLTVAALNSYLDGHANSIRSKPVAERAAELFTLYLKGEKNTAAPMSYWTPSRQLEFAKWCRSKHKHSPAYIARIFNVMRSAFLDAEKVKMRDDATGGRVEAALVVAAPKIVMTQPVIASELKIAPRPPRNPTLSPQQIAAILDGIKSEHLFRFTIMMLCTWARPEAVLDFDPETQIDWNAGTIDLAPPDWVRTKKRRPRQPMSQCLEGWLRTWMVEDQAKRLEDEANGKEPCQPGLIVYKRKRVVKVKQAMRRLGSDVGVPGFSQYSLRHFMTDQVRKQFRGVSRELRSHWLGHVVKDGSRTTDNYESDDPLALQDVALATDCVLAMVAEHCSRPLFTVELLLNRQELKEIGARQIPKRPNFIGKSGAAGSVPEPVSGPCVRENREKYRVKRRKLRWRRLEGQETPI